MAKKKEAKAIEVIEAIALIEKSRSIQNIPYSVLVLCKNKRKKRGKINRNNIDKYLYF